LSFDVVDDTIVGASMGTIRWGGFFRSLFWLSLTTWLFWWLLNHRGCESVSRTSLRKNHARDDIDSVPVRSSNDTMLLRSDRITFSVYDWSEEDHDTINVYINDQLVKQNVELNKNIYSWFQQGLSKGNNKLTLESVNDGTLGPASPTIEMNDGKNLIVFQARVYKGKPNHYFLVLR
jgi:hypothetical protein